VNSFRYFAGVYIDSVKSRVVLCGSPDYASATVVEPQIPVAWSGTNIRARVNLGALPEDTDTAYLFVFDSDNAHNPTGHPIMLYTGVTNAARNVANMGITHFMSGAQDNIHGAVLVDMAGRTVARANGLGAQRNRLYVAAMRSDGGRVVGKVLVVKEPGK
jgi:hypothetical protein